MSIIVEHDKRKRKILEKALDVFVEEGYEDVTFQKIADRCGITRTTLYIYFKNKREIFLWSIKQLVSGIETTIMQIVNNTSLNTEKCFRKILMSIVDAIGTNKKLFGVLLLYLIQLQKSGVDPRERVMRRVIKLRHIMTTLLIRGAKSGEFKKINAKVVNDMFYGLIESAIFRLAVLAQENIDDIRDILNFAVDGIVAKRSRA